MGASLGPRHARVAERLRAGAGHGQTAAMRSRKHVALAAGLGALAAVLVPATGAHAETFRHQDATGDVDVVDVRYSGGGTGSRTTSVDPAERLGDIQRFTVQHTRWSLSIATTLRAWDDENENGWSASVVTSAGERYEVSRVNPELAREPVRVRLERVREGGEGTAPVSCDGLRVSRTPDGVVAKVPTRCLRTPWKVRVGVLAANGYEVRPDQERYRGVADDALRDGGARTDRTPRLSPWIAR